MRLTPRPAAFARPGAMAGERAEQGMKGKEPFQRSQDRRACIIFDRDSPPEFFLAAGKLGWLRVSPPFNLILHS